MYRDCYYIVLSIKYIFHKHALKDVCKKQVALSIKQNVGKFMALI